MICVVFGCLLISFVAGWPVELKNTTIYWSSDFPHDVSRIFLFAIGKGIAEEEFATILVRNDTNILEKFIFDLSRDISLEDGTYITRLVYLSENPKLSRESKIKIWLSKKSDQQILEVYKSRDYESTDQRIYEHRIDLLVSPSLSLQVWTEFNGSTYNGKRQQHQVIQCRSRNGRPSVYPQISFRKNYTMNKMTNYFRENKTGELIVTLRIKGDKRDNNAEARCHDKNALEKAKIAVYSHPSKISIYPPKRRLSMRKGDNLECRVRGGRSNVSHTMEALVDGDQYNRASDYISIVSEDPRRSYLRVIRFADWVTLRVSCKAVSTINNDTKTLTLSLPPIIIRPRDFRDDVDANMYNLIRSFNRKLASKTDLMPSLIWRLENFTEGDVNRLSPEFFSHSGGYRMQIRCTHRDQQQGILLDFRILRSENDAYLSWPFTRKVTMSLVDQRDNTNGHSRSNIYDFLPKYQQEYLDRPKGLSNKWIKNDGWISLVAKPEKEILGQGTIFIRNNMILIRCYVTLT